MGGRGGVREREREREVQFICSMVKTLVSLLAFPTAHID